jgi:hypothetical protein
MQEKNNNLECIHLGNLPNEHRMEGKIGRRHHDKPKIAFLHPYLDRFRLSAKNLFQHTDLRLIHPV